MLISVINCSSTIADKDLQKAIRAINRQIAEDFAPYWGFGGQLRLEARPDDTTTGAPIDKRTLSGLRGDAVLYVWDKPDVAHAVGYHDKNANDVPYGFVFTELAAQLKEPWSVTLSHETLELIGDPLGNLLVQGPHPDDAAKDAYHWFEMCDAVQAQSYEIDGVRVANFVLPGYFAPIEQPGARNDFLSASDKTNGKLKSFGVAPGGYIGYFEPMSKTPQTFIADDKAESRRQAKALYGYGRSFVRTHAAGFGSMTQRHLDALAAGQPASGAAPAGGDPIRHVVVLMLENQSFDRLLGGLSKINPAVEGVSIAPREPHANPGRNGQPVEQTARRDYVVRRDPKHEHADAMSQLDNGQLDGFVSNYLQTYPDATDDEMAQVMGYFPLGDTPAGDTLPVIHTLAREFAVCDHWFSSMPGPTWQNRFFVHSGTTLGHVMMPSLKRPLDMHVYYQPTIFDRLSDAGVPWKIFHHGVPQSIVLTRLLERYTAGQGYGDMDDFFKLAQGPADQFPAYAFIEPDYFGRDENDQHPPADMRDGEALIADVYNALRANPGLWSSCLFIVMYDEHGGFYDHVPPPATVPPDAHTAEWSFDRLGMRVPALLVSPWVDKGTVVKTVLEHTSLLRYLSDKWGLPPLSARMRPEAGASQVNSFAAELTKRSAPRTDTPDRIDVARPARAARAAQAEPPIEGSRESLLMYVNSLPELASPDAAAPLERRAMPAPQAGPEPALDPDLAKAKLARLQAAQAPQVPQRAVKP